MTEFGQLLFETAAACQGRSCTTLDRVLTAKVRAWADDQPTIPAHITHPAIEPAEPFEGVGR